MTDDVDLESECCATSRAREDLEIGVLVPRDLLCVRGPGVRSLSAVRPPARTRTRRSESKCSAIYCTREDPEFRDVGINASRPYDVGMHVQVMFPSEFSD